MELYTDSTVVPLFRPDARAALQGLWLALRASGKMHMRKHKLLAGGCLTALLLCPAFCQAQTISIVSGDGQLVCLGCTGAAGAYAPLVVQVNDATGAPVANTTVTWTATQFGSSPVTATTDTDSSGQSSYVFTLLPVSSESVLSPATVVASAVLDSVSVSVTFVETSVALEGSGPIPVSVNLITPTAAPALTGSAGTTAATPIVVGVTGPDGPVSGIEVTLQAGGSGPSVACKPQSGSYAGLGTVLTDSAGTAICTPVFGGQIGTGTYTIYVGGSFATFGPAPLTVTAGPPALIKYISGNNQAVYPGVIAPLPLVAVVTDIAGNPSVGVPVLWSVRAGTATISNVVTVSLSNGYVSANVTPTAGPVAVTVALAADSSVQYTFTVNVAVVITGLLIVSGNNQQVLEGNIFPVPLVVVANDNNLPVPGATVNFAVTSGAATLSAPSAITNAAGQASVTATAGATPGPAVVTASVTSTACPGGICSYAFNLTVIPNTQSPVTITQVANAAGFQPGIVPGGRVTIFGQGLVPQGSVAAPTSGPVPLTLGGVTVTFTSGSLSMQAPIFSVSSQNGTESVTVQAPFELSPGNAFVSAATGAGTSPPFSSPVFALQPGIFQTSAPNGVLYATAQRPNGSFVSPANPAVAGEVITMQVTGLGQVSPAAATNQVGVAGQNVLAGVIVGVENNGTSLISAAYSPGQIGLYTVAFQIPDDATAATSAPLAILACSGPCSATNSTNVFGNPSSIPIAAFVPPSLLPTPTSLTFNYQQGSTQPAAQTLTVASSVPGSVLSLTAAASTTSGGNWLSVSPASATASVNLTVSVNATGLATSAHSGSIIITSSGAGNSPLTVPVTLNVLPAGAPAIASLAPSSAIAGGPAFTLMVNGAGFLSGAMVQWNGSPLATSFVNGNQLTAAVPASLIAAPGSAGVTVVNPGGLGSNTAMFAIAAMFASPQSLSFTYQEGGSIPSPQVLSVFSNGAPVKYSVAAPANWLKAVATTGQTPDNVTVTLQNLSSLPACPGPASCSATATVTITPLGAPAPIPAIVNVTLTVIPVQPLLSVWPEYLTVSSVAGGSSVQQQVQVFNTGGGTLNYTVTAPSVPWLTVSCNASGAVTLSTPASICLTVNLAALQTGNYHAPLVINAGAGTQPATVNVTLQVAQAEPLILLLPGAMEFTAVSGGQAPAPQTLNVLNIGTGTMDWSAQAGGKWLQLSTTGCTSASQTVTGSATGGGPAGSLTVCVDPAEATLGGNYGQIAVSVPNGPAGNSEVIAVLLNVLPAGSALPELTAPTGVTLRATAGSSAPAGSVTLSNPNGTPISFMTATVTQDGTAWLSVSLPSGSLAGQSTAPLQVQGNAAALAAGIYHGQVRVGFGDGTSQVINVILTVSAASGTTSVGESARGRRDHPMASPPNCPGGTVLPPQFINLSQQGFQVQAGSVQQLLVQVKDSCGNPITDTDVGATMSVVIYNSTTQATLETPNLVYSDTQNAWQYGWTPSSAEVGPVGMYAVAGVGVGNNSIGNRSDIWSGTVTGAAPEAAAEPTAVVNAANANLDTIVQVNQVAAGSYITIYGELLADGSGNPYPFPTEDQGSTVLLGGVPLLLEYISPTQVNALVPTTAGLPMNAPLPLKIQRDTTLSVEDLQVSITTVQPAIFILDQNSQGAVLIANTADVVAPAGYLPGSRPAQAGVDYIEIFCNGLGPVNNPPADGQPAGTNPVPTTKTVPQVTIGGVNAPALFSGLSPGSVALYQVNVQVPAGSQTGNAVPIVIQMGDVSSNTAYIAVQ